MDIDSFKIMNPYPIKPQLNILEKSLLFNQDVKKWLEDNFVTVRINYDSKQVALVKEMSEIPKEAIKPKNQKNSNQIRINSLSLANTIRDLFDNPKGKLVLIGKVNNDYIIFEKLS